MNNQRTLTDFEETDNRRPEVDGKAEERDTVYGVSLLFIIFLTLTVPFEGKEVFKQGFKTDKVFERIRK